MKRQKIHRNPLARLMPVPREVRERFVLRAYTALESLISGKSGDDVEAWRDLADVVNVTETLSVHLKKLDAQAIVYTSQANKAMRESQQRYKEGKSLRLDYQGIESMRAVLQIYEQVLTHLTERQVEEAFQRTADEVRKLIKSGVEAVSL